MIAVLCWLIGPALAGPGFDGVGGPSRAPGFDDEVAEEGAAWEEVMEREAQILALVEEHDPAMHKRLVRLSQTNRRAYVAALVRVSRNVQRAQRDPGFRARMQEIRAKTKRVEELAAGFHTLPKRQQQARRGELERVAGELMDLKQADRRMRLQEMRGKLNELQAEIDRRESEREAIIGEFLDRLLEKPLDL